MVHPTNPGYKISVVWALSAVGLELILFRVFFPSVLVKLFVQFVFGFVIFYGHRVTARPSGLLAKLLNFAGLVLSLLTRILGAGAVPEAARLVRSGTVVAFPTDTVYGLACDPWSDEAVSRLFTLKGREKKPVPVLCSGFDEASAVVRLEGTSLELARRFWPGALTIVAPLRRRVPELLDQGTGFLGVRVPDHPLALSLARELGGWTSGTSANISGQPSCTTAGQVVAQLGDRLEAVLDGGQTPGGESTVVKVVGGSIEVLRRGKISVEPGTSESS